MSKEIKKAVAMFSWISSRKMNDKRVGEFSLYDLIEMVKFLTDGDSDAKN